MRAECAQRESARRRSVRVSGGAMIYARGAAHLNMRSAQCAADYVFVISDAVFIFLFHTLMPCCAFHARRCC